MSRLPALRAALDRYDDGVHRLEPPATLKAIAETERALQHKLPADYRDFLRESNGGELFHEDVRLFGVPPVAEYVGTIRLLEGAEGLVQFGEAAGALCFDERGRVVHVLDEGRRVEGSRFERWVEAVFAQGACIYQPDGEFREEAFGDEPGEASPRTRRKQVQAAVKADPEAPAWHEDLAALLLDEGQPRRAAAELEKAASLDPGPSAWFALGKLRRDAGEPDRAADAFRRAAEDEPDPDEAAFAWAHAARAAIEAALPDGAAFAERVARLCPTFVEQQRTAAGHLLDGGDVEQAIERLTLAQAVSPDDAEAARLLVRARARQSLPVIH
jgi:tetratricopeptide (TPR) repeat protein